MANWAVAVTWPNYERRVERALQKSGFEVYLPRLRNPHRHITTLLFPRYVFAAPGELWLNLRKTYGVSKLLRSGDEEQPAMVPDDQLAHIRQHEDKDGFIQLPTKPRFRRGQRVRITLGAMTGQVGTYQGFKRRNVELVRLALGTVSVPYGNLVSAEV
jgi:transcription antitermination factor NusG